MINLLKKKVDYLSVIHPQITGAEKTCTKPDRIMD